MGNKSQVSYFGYKTLLKLMAICNNKVNNIECSNKYKLLSLLIVSKITSTCISFFEVQNNL